MFELDNEKHTFSTVKVGERGQIVIPKETREMFSIKPGDNLIIFANKKTGIVIIKSDKIKEFAKKILENIENIENNNNKK
ncbi:MAG: AbrB/MazE/SpoVT family DNA-binding domain-containing protein [Actinobacteria bacterium]|nr:AbrB/MazE/SpoVT family DNA-binding domain-containing protein [Actinomycetota bacterium]